MKTENIKLLIDTTNETGLAVIEVENALKNQESENFNHKNDTARRLVEELAILRVALQADQTFEDVIKGLFGIGTLAKCDKYIKNIAKVHTENELTMFRNLKDATSLLKQDTLDN